MWFLNELSGLMLTNEYELLKKKSLVKGFWHFENIWLIVNFKLITIKTGVASDNWPLLLFVLFVLTPPHNLICPFQLHLTLSLAPVLTFIILCEVFFCFLLFLFKVFSRALFLKTWKVKKKRIELWKKGRFMYQILFSLHFFVHFLVILKHEVGIIRLGLWKKKKIYGN